MPLYNPPVTVQDEGTTQGSINTMNFTGSGVTATVSGNIATVNIPGGSGTGATGTGTIDFGVFPGTTYTTATITGQASITANSIVNVWIRPIATADHLADEHLVDPPKLIAGNIVAGTGFTIHGFAGDNPGAAGKFADGTRMHGLWTFQWKWE